ncbi:hypothetical protein XU18_0382 [Perkinsela sp. CCAP 1560/4]|nr:hypothetical protein XU18_0382 [Perkinsela sp. CCAP 1560/4]|eukprot:KNH09697.1 hypothetical protein XU18_0382 [Perkinsela sp. CCAP 1560/4]
MNNDRVNNLLSSDYPPWVQLLHYLQSIKDDTIHATHAKADGIHLTFFADINRQNPVSIEVNRWNSLNSDQSSQVTSDNAAEYRKLGILGGVILDVLLDTEPWVFYVIIGEPSQSSSSTNRSKTTLTLCIHMSCLKRWPSLAIVGAAVLIHNATLIWVPFESNLLLQYDGCNVFTSLDDQSERSDHENDLKSHPKDNLPTFTPVVVIAESNVLNVFQEVHNSFDSLQTLERDRLSASCVPDGSSWSPSHLFEKDVPMEYEYRFDCEGNPSNPRKRKVDHFLTPTSSLPCGGVFEDSHSQLSRKQDASLLSLTEEVLSETRTDLMEESSHLLNVDDPWSEYLD